MGGSKDTRRADLLRTSFHQESEGNRLRCQLASFLGWWVRKGANGKYRT